MRRAAIYGTAIVLFHMLVTLIHGAAHSELHIGLSRAELTFVRIVILLCPLVAMGLLWTPWRTSGLVVLTLSMAGSLLFGLYHHFMVTGPDHVGQQTPGLWANAFGITAYGILMIEAFGTYAGVHLLLRRDGR
jgi:hypothetical protein